MVKKESVIVKCIVNEIAFLFNFTAFKTLLCNEQTSSKYLLLNLKRERKRERNEKKPR